MANEKLTLDEIAEKAGVSRTTASRVINNRPHVRPALRERVMRVVEATGYRLNPVARSLAMQRSEIMGLVIPRSTHTLFDDPYFPSLIQGIAKACNHYNYTFSLFLFENEDDEEQLYPRISRRGLLDGIILQAGEIKDNLTSRLMQENIPVLVIGRPKDAPNANYLDVDNVTGARNAVTHLLAVGRRRVATITGALTTTVGLDRLEGYRQVLQEHGYPIHPALIVEGDFTKEGGYQAMQQLLPQQPDAVFIASDTMALGAMDAIYEAGLHVPEDIAIVGFDDLPPAAQATPPLTTIRQPVAQFGGKAVELLLDIIEKGPHPPRRILMDTELVVRESCGAHAG